MLTGVWFAKTVLITMRELWVYGNSAFRAEVVAVMDGEPRSANSVRAALLPPPVLKSIHHEHGYLKNVYGTSLPGVNINIFLTQKNHNRTIMFSTWAEDDGVWVVEVSRTTGSVTGLQSGIYSVVAVASDPLTLAKSIPSEPIEFVVSKSFFEQVFDQSFVFVQFVSILIIILLVFVTVLTFV
jgi:hypothetical protein